MHFIKDKEGCQYGDLSNLFMAEKKMYNMAHQMHNMKYKPPIEENPQKEVLQPCIKTGKGFTLLFYWVAIFFHYTSDIEKISA